MTSGTDGGMNGATIADTTVIADANDAEYPRLRMARISTAPRPAISATAAPVPPASKTEATTLT